MNKLLKTVSFGLCALLVVACGHSKIATIKQITVNVMKVEDVKVIVEDNTNITAGDGQRFYKITVGLNSTELSGDPLFNRFSNWSIKILDSDGKEVGPVFGWIFIDKGKSQARIYSNPLAAGGKVKSIVLEGKALSLE